MNIFHKAASLISNGLIKLGSLVAGYSPNTRVTDDGIWQGMLNEAGPQDIIWSGTANNPGREQHLKEALQAWRENFLVRQIVRLQTAYVLGDEGIIISSKRPTVRKFIDQFWNYQPETEDDRLLPPNDLTTRLVQYSDEFQRAGEIFIILYTNPENGMSQIRAKPASCICHIETDPDDYEKELYYLEPDPERPAEFIKWPSPLTAEIDEPMMLHYTVNKPLGATRGDSDILVVLPWAKRYTAWLKDRTRFNRIRNRAAILELQTTGDVKKRQQDFMASEQVATQFENGVIFVTKMNEETLKSHSANIQAQDAEADGRAFRLAVATGADIPLHFLAEGDTANRATAVEMGDPTHRYYRQRQNELVAVAKDICEQAYRRAVALDKATMPANKDLRLTADVPDISRTDNKILADAASLVADIMIKLKGQGWVDDETSIRLVYKFLGEPIEDKQIQKWLEEIEENKEEIEDQMDDNSEEEELSGRKNGHKREPFSILTS